MFLQKSLHFCRSFFHTGNVSPITNNFWAFLRKPVSSWWESFDSRLCNWATKGNVYVISRCFLAFFSFFFFLNLNDWESNDDNPWVVFCFKMKQNFDFFWFFVFIIKSKNEFQISISIFNKNRKMSFCSFFYEIFSVPEHSSDQ